MRLAIADPPYLGRGAKLYGTGWGGFDQWSRVARARPAGWSVGDSHPDASEWDDPETHRQLVERLSSEYDGWAIAMAWDNLRHYLRWVPTDVWIGIWVKPAAPPGGARVHNAWEPVVIRPPDGRRRAMGPGTTIRGVLTTSGCRPEFVGAKPRAWTRWVLDMLGYDQDTDAVVDMFPGSNAVTNELAQLTLPMRHTTGP